jgi:hypothetical protein
MIRFLLKTGYKETVAAMGKSNYQYPQIISYLNTISSKHTSEHIWNVIGYEKLNQSHPVSQMKIALEKIIEEALKT